MLLTNSAKLTDPDLYKEFETRIYCTLKLKSLHRFTSTATTVEEITTMQEGKLGKGFKEFLNKVIVEKGKNKEELVVVDPKIGIKVISDIDTLELFCGIRSQSAALLNGLDPKDLATMSLGLSHSLSRFKLKFSPDKVMSKILSENLAYAKVVKLLEELEATIKAGAEIFMGTEISESDLAHIHALCDQVISISEVFAQLYDSIAPNLTALVGELVGARLISHAGSLLNLAKHPARLIYHASLVGQAPHKLKGKMELMVATKTALSVCVDALTDVDEKTTPSAPTIGLENRAKLEARLRSLEAESDVTGVRRFAMGPNQQKRIRLGLAAPTYNPATDAVGLVSTQREPMEEAVKAVLDVKEEKRRAKRRAEKEKAAAAQEGEEKPEAAAVDGEADAMEVDGEEKVDEKSASGGRAKSHPRRQWTMGWLLQW
ncbi:Nop domain-containing protein [Russula emetica]|nr:Nop domain-containing protein [Russula emetica]